MRRSLALALLVALSLAAGPAGSAWAAPTGTGGAAPAKARTAKGRPTAAATAPAPAHAGTAAHATTTRRPLTLAAQNIEGRAEGARVLFVHTGPKIALADAPKHPSYLRDDFTAALSSPVTVHVRNIEPLRTPTPPGGSR